MKLAIPEDARLEIKFSAYATNLSIMEQWLKLHQTGFVNPFPNRHVNNIYFDTNDFAAYEQNISGVSARIKVRYRWYGNAIAPNAGVLEIKCKRNYFGWKLRHSIPHMEANTEDTWATIRQMLDKQTGFDGRFWLDTYSVPVLINRYYRRYYVSQDAKVRVTIDTNQAVWDQRFAPRPNYVNKANLVDNMVVEFKFAREDRQLASDLIQSIPIRVSRHSKYINGVRAISGN